MNYVYVFNFCLLLVHYNILIQLRNGKPNILVWWKPSYMWSSTHMNLLQICDYMKNFIDRIKPV